MILHGWALWFAFPGKLAGGKAAALHVWELLACESGDDRYVCGRSETQQCASDVQLCIVQCELVHCAMRPQPMGYRHRWDHFSPRCPILKDLKDGLEDVGHIGQFRKWKWYLYQSDMIFVQNFTQPDFQAKSFTPQTCIICDIFLANKQLRCIKYQ